MDTKAIRGKALLDMEFNTMSKAPIDTDPIDWPHSVATCTGPEYNQLRIDSDDGNQSSYGYELWTFTSTHATMIENYGRDCFDMNPMDQYYPNGISNLTIPIRLFHTRIAWHRNYWEGRSERGHS